MSPATIPECVLVDFHKSEGTVPPGRWGHSAAVINDRLYVFGGEGDQAFGDLNVYDPENAQWHTLKACTLEGPLSMNGHAACSTGSQMFIYGGRQGRKVLHGLYKLCTESMSWQRCKEGSTMPPALVAHTLTAVGQHGILCFGGQGKKVYNTVHKLDPATCLWAPFKTIGVAPSPRHGHTAIWDSSDSLIVFGGINGNSQCLADVHVLSPSTGCWFTPQCTGDVPQARANHAAVYWGPNLMLVFGGCDPKAAGRFMNDVFVLDTATFTWHCLRVMGSPPAPRYWHTMVMLQGKAMVYGGSNATRTFDLLFSISSDWTRELESVAAELGRMSAGSNGRTQVPSAAHMRLQFDDMLAQQGAAEALEVERRKHKHTTSLLHEEHKTLQAANAEVLQLQLLQDEQNAKHQRQIVSLKDELAQLRCTHLQCVSSLQASKKETLDLQQQIRQQQDQRAVVANQKAEYETLQQQHALLQSACQQLQQELQNDQLALSVKITAEHLQQSQLVQPKSPRVFSMRASSILDSYNAEEIGMQQTRLQSDSALIEGQIAVKKLQEQDTHSHDALLQLQQLAEQVAGLRLEQDGLLMHPVSEIYTVVDTLEHALSNVRNMARSKCSAEVTKLTQLVEHMEQSLEDYKVCPLCMEHDQEFVLNCGHQLCPSCSDSLHSCPFCRTSISFRTKVFRA